MKQKFEVITTYDGMTKYIVYAENIEAAKEQFESGYYDSFEEMDCYSNEQIEKINLIAEKVEDEKPSETLKESLGMNE